MPMATLSDPRAAVAAPSRSPGLSLDLFAPESRAATPEPTLVESPCLASDPPDPGELYAALWKDYWHACEGFAAEMGTLQGRESALMLPAAGAGAFSRVFSGPDAARHAEQARIDVAAEITRELARIASERFCGTGCAPLRINVDELLADVVQGPAWRGRRAGPLAVFFFDPAEVWAGLCREFGGTVGIERGYREAATQIRQSFCLESGKDVERRRSGVVLSMRVWVESSGMRPGQKKLTYQSTERVLETLPALRTFAAWADDDGGLGEGLHRLDEHFGWAGTRSLSSRKKVVLCESLYVVTYQTRLEFVMAPALAEKLQLFLGLFGEALDADQ